MGTFYYFIIFLLILLILLISYIIYLYFSNNFSNNFYIFESLQNPDATTPSSQPPNIVVPGEADLDAAKLKATTNNNDKALSYVNDYYKINDKYKQILIDKQTKEDTTKYKSDELYAPTFPNRMVSKIANSGIPFVGYLAKIYVPLPNSTKCHNYDNNFDGWCKKEYGNNNDFGKGTPSQLVYGQVSKYPGACPGGLLGAGGQGRAECAAGWAGNSKLPVNSTQCYLTTADFDGACREQSGANNDYKQGITSDYIFGVKKYLTPGKFGCWAGQRRAQCGLNYAGGKLLAPNSTKCHLWTDDFDEHCRYYAGDGQTPVPSSTVPSQDIWGMEKKYAGGCITGQGRAQCAKGYSGGTKLKSNSTQCYLWTDNFNQRCKDNYGEDWILDTTQSGYGKYAGGCITGQGRGVCIKKSDVPKNTILPGTNCGLWTSVWPNRDAWCRSDFGNDYGGGSEFGDNLKPKQYDCPSGSGRVTCKFIPKDTTKLGSKCGAWDSISNSWCKNDYGPYWEKTGRGQHGCAWGQGKAECKKTQ
jgi:hypothetical protein